MIDSKKIFQYLKDHKGYSLLVICLTLWVCFISPTSFQKVQNHKREIQNLQDEADYYRQKIEQDKAAYQTLQNNKKAIETYARETYFMKKPNEDVYVIIEE